MPGRKSKRGLIAFVLAAALFFHALPVISRAQTGIFVRIGTLEELVTGQYVLLLPQGYAPGVLEEDWLTAVQPEITEDTLTDPRGGLWKIRVEEGGAVLFDSGGTPIAPTSDGSNGITAGETLWNAECREGLFFFRSFSAEEPVTLAANVSLDYGFRAYRDSTIAVQPGAYPSAFALYRLEEQKSEPPAPTETTQPEETAPETTAPETTPPETEETLPPPQLPWNLYFGRLHGHSNLSDGPDSPQTVYSKAKSAGLDFYAVTDHSDSFDNHTLGAVGEDGTAVSTAWAAGKAAAADATLETFLGLYGYEMSWPRSRQLGHLVTLGTPGWQSAYQEGYAEDPAALANYYEALSTVPGSVSQFCHPGEDTGDFQAFGHWSPEADRAVSLLEIGGERGVSLEGFLSALEKGWHVAPAVGRQVHDEIGTARTVVLAKELTEQALLEALASRRVYATMDSDLQIYFELNGSAMGSVIPAQTQAELSVTFYDPTDSAANVEVLGGKGSVLAAKTAAGCSETLTFSLPGNEPYYFLRITQPDGDVAVTAPVWLVRATDMGIADFTADTQVPVRGKKLSLMLSLYNNETVDFQAETAVFSIAGEVIHAVNLETVPGGGSSSYTFSYTHPGLGITDIRALVTGTVGGETRTYEKTLTLRFRMEDTVGHILVDGSHGGALSYDRLAEIAAGENIAVTVAENVTGQLLNTAQLLVIPSGSKALEPEFLALAAEFVKNGGSLVLCGRADTYDTDVHWAAQGNKLLKALGLSLRLCDDTAADDVHNGGNRTQLAVTKCNAESDWCRGITAEQVFRQSGGCTVMGGTWLVKGFDTTKSEDGDGDGLVGEGAVLLAAEDSHWGGHVFAAGGDFLADMAMPAQDNYWDPASINQGVLENLLEIERLTVPMSTVAAARESREGAVVRLQGYVTAGTSNKYNRFPETIYIQDKTGGIAVTDFRDSGIQVGTPLEVIGYRAEENGNPVLKLMEYRVLDKAAYRFDPDNIRHSQAMDYEAKGGQLLQVEGTVKSVTLTSDGKGVSRLTLEDARGDLAEVLIEEYIFSGATGKNTLASEIKKGRTVRARGILHLDEGGKSVLRVRNCDEVVYVPPNIIPKTGDDIWNALTALLFSGGSLGMLRKKRKKPD